MSVKDTFLAILVVIIWGVNFPVIKVGLETMPPFLFAAVRFIIIAIPAVLFIPFPKTSIWNVLGVGLFLGILKYCFLFFAMVSDSSAGLASLILQSQVFFTIGLSIFIYKQKISKIQITGIFIAVFGFSFFFLSSGTSITTLGLTLILMAAFSWSIANLVMMSFKGVNLFHFIIWVCLIPPIPLLILSYFIESKDPLAIVLSTTVEGWFALIYASHISMLLGFALWGWLLKSYSAAVVTPYALLVPVVGIIASSIFLNETMSLLEVIGAVLIMTGLLFSALGKRLFKSYHV